MNCGRCGAPLVSGAGFCGACGARVSAPAAPAPAPPAPAPLPAPVQAPPAGYAPAPGHPPAHAQAPWPPQAVPGPRYAGFWRRLLAAAIDGAVFWPVWWVASGLYELAGAAVLEGAVFSPDGAGLSLAMGLVAAGRWALFAVLALAYYAVPESTRRGATLGKLIVRLRVARTDGSRTGILRSIARTAFKTLSALPLLFGFLMAAWSGRKQALHDLMSGCVVLRV